MFLGLGPVTWLLLSPALAACVLFFVPRTAESLIRSIALGAVSLSLVLAIAVAAGYDTGLGGYQFTDRFSWAPTLGISFYTGVDGIGAVLLLLTAICSFTGVIAASQIKKRVKEYYIFYLFLIVGCLGVLASLDIFFMYFFYEMAVIPVFPLIGVWGSGKKEYATMKLTLYLTLGAVLALFAILSLYWTTGLNTFSFPTLEVFLARDPLPAAFQIWAFPFLMVGFGVILTLWPFHTWSPIGYASAPTSVSMLHAGVLKKLGAFMIIRLGITLMPDGAAVWMPYVAVIAAINIVYCGLVAYTQKDLKYVLGYSSCSHMGLILLGLSSLTPMGLTGTVYFMFAHGIMAALGFALVGYIYDQAHTRLISDFGGLGKKVPVVGLLFAMTALASSGIPGFASFIGEVLILLGSWDRYPLPTICAIIGLLITAGYMLKTIRGVFQGPFNTRWESLEDAKGPAKLSFILLIGVLIAGGVVPSLLTPLIESGTRPITDRYEKRVPVTADASLEDPAHA